MVTRPAQHIRHDVLRQLNDNNFIDASDIAVSVEGSQVTLDGTTNNQMAISLARALSSNTRGVSRVESRLRVRQNPRVYETPPAPVYRVP